MEQLFSSGRIVDLILVMMVLEGLALAYYFRVTGRGVPVAGIVANSAAGGALLLALRSCLSGSQWYIIAAFLGLSLVAHLADLTSRWRHSP